MREERDRPEDLIIRPPSEARSALVRVTRGCAWNRCKFCGQYPYFGEPEFSVRPVEEVERDIALLAERRPRARTVFLGDADPLLVPVGDFEEIASCLRAAFPRLERVTCYARASTLWKKGREGLARLARAGLDRVHIGLESGDLATLRFQRKGQSPRVVVEAGQWLREEGIEVSFYVLLGLGGRDRWQEHIDATAEVVRAVEPEFVRVRRLWLYRAGDQGEGPECPLWEDVRAGTFIPQTAEGTVLELRRLLDRLAGVRTHFTCDHANNYVQVEGRLPGAREAMLEVIDRFLAQPEAAREQHYALVGDRI